MKPSRILACITASLAAACSTPSQSAFTPILPDPAGFPYVAEYMVQRCGTLDCHGSAYRNLRIYGDEGLRYSAADRPCVPQATTDAELGQDYDSVVGLEPETMSTIVTAHGADPQRLTMIAKPLGIESHMGGTLFATGDDAYVCMTSWLAGQTDTAACLAAMPPTLCGVPAASAIDAGEP